MSGRTNHYSLWRERRNAHGKARFAIKNDPSTPSADASAIQSRHAFRHFQLAGLAGHSNWQSERTGTLLLSVTLDPKYDTPKVLSDYAA
jgi:hypothetical protein